jgi:hypothetical protein
LKNWKRSISISCAAILSVSSFAAGNYRRNRSGLERSAAIIVSAFDGKRNQMNKKVGLWLDFNKAVIVTFTDQGEEIKRITSSMGHYVRFSSSVPGDGSPEDVRDRRFWNHLGAYYDNVFALIRDANVIQIFGPGEAKYELKKRLEREGLAEQLVSVDNADWLSDLQIATKARGRFPVRSQFDIS